MQSMKFFKRLITVKNKEDNHELYKEQINGKDDVFHESEYMDASRNDWPCVQSCQAAFDCSFGNDTRLRHALSDVANAFQGGVVSAETMQLAAEMQQQANAIVDFGVQKNRKSAGGWYDIFSANTPDEFTTSHQLNRFQSIREFRNSQTCAPSTVAYATFGMPPVSPVEGKIILDASDEFHDKCGSDLNLNLFELDTATQGNALVEVGFALLHPYVENSELECSTKTLINFLATLQRNYRATNPYHNHIHGAEVAHLTCAFLNRIDFFSLPHVSEFQHVLIIVAALAHDVGHPGVNNGFLVKSMDQLAIVYNDRAVLENYHASRTFQILSEAPSCDIFSFTASNKYQAGRAKIIDIILATDMAEHFSGISTFRLRRLGTCFDYVNNEADSWEVVKMCVKMADLGHSLVEWTQHKEWSRRVTEEFYNQGDREVERDLPVSALCDRSKHNDMAKSQCLFLEHVVCPLLAELTAVNSNIMLMTQLMANKKKWEELAEEGHTKR